MSRLSRTLTKIVESPWLNLLVGSILVITSVSEIRSTFWDDLIHLHLRVHHGIIVYGLFTIAKSIPNLHEGVRSISRVKE